MTVSLVTNSPSEVGELAKTSHHKIASIYVVFDEVEPPASPIWIDVENCCNHYHHNCITYTETDVEKLHVYETIISLFIIRHWLGWHCFLTTIVSQWRSTQVTCGYLTSYKSQLQNYFSKQHSHWWSSIILFDELFSLSPFKCFHT